MASLGSVLPPILDQLSIKDLGRVSLVCKQWNAHANRNEVWKKFLLDYFDNGQIQEFQRESQQSMKDLVRVKLDFRGKDRLTFDYNDTKIQVLFNSTVAKVHHMKRLISEAYQERRTNPNDWSIIADGSFLRDAELFAPHKDKTLTLTGG